MHEHELETEEQFKTKLIKVEEVAKLFHTTQPKEYVKRKFCDKIEAVIA